MGVLKKISVLTVFGLIALTGCGSHNKELASVEQASSSGLSGRVSRSTQPDAARTFAARMSQVSVKDHDGFRVNSLIAPSNQTYYFPFDSVQTRSIDRQALRVQAQYLAAHPRAKIVLEGNTDSRGSREYNIGLGWRRDQAIDKQLLEYGVSPSQIRMVSYGKERPAKLGKGPLVRSLNRRVELKYRVVQ